ncbi:sensor histidine kinase [Agaribacter flavus]|uniref:histidine kinase n=1 Tax=Agaribacter flavus TaxID=1902781 RepID=A0ABV7FMP1_9ALTE
MGDAVNYARAYERERKAREMAEQLLDDKSRELYANVVELKKTVDVLKSTQAQLVQSEKMASLGILSAGVAHEINNPIGFCLSNINTLSEYCKVLLSLDSALMGNDKSAEARLSDYQQLRRAEDIAFIKEDTQELLDDTIHGLERVRDIVANLRKLSHKGTDEFEKCDINECIHDCLKATENELKYKMKVELVLGECPMINGMPSEINQIFINLFINACQACEQKGILRITSYVAQDFVVVEVADNGVGISDDSLSKIFDPFYTSKPVGVGTGLGLSISHGIMDKHNGSISVQSAVGKGTRFTLKFPLST